MGLFKKLKKTVKKVGKVVGKVAAKAAPVASLIPGVGTLAAAGLGAGGNLLAGKGLKGALQGGISGAMGSLAIGGLGATGILGKLGSSGGFSSILSSLGGSGGSGSALGGISKALGMIGGGGGGGGSGGGNGGGYESPGLDNTFRQSENSIVTNLGIADQNVLRGLSSQLAGNAGQYTRENAIADSRGIVDSVTRQLRENAIPQILSGQTSAGAYNSTASTALSNDAVQRASETASNLAMDQITKYGALQTQNLGASADVINALKGAVVTTNSDIDRRGGPGGITGTINSGLDLVSSIGQLGGLFSGVLNNRSAIPAAGITPGIVTPGTIDEYYQSLG